MRRTMFAVPPDLAALLHAGCAAALAPAERRRLAGWLVDQGLADGPVDEWLDELRDRMLAALDARGEATARELVEDVPELGRQISFGEGKRWAGKVGLSTRLLFLLATGGDIVRARPLGTWVSSQYRWARMSSWLGGDLAAHAEADARAELVRRYLAAYGPASFTDVKWWSGWTVGVTRAALAAVGAVDVGELLALPGDDEVPSLPAGEAALLPGLDVAVMGWTERSWILEDDHVARLFDRNGNAGPTVWWEGRVVGGWGQRPSGEIVTGLLEDAGAEAEQAIAAEAAALEDWLDGVVVRSRFPVPLEKELRGT